ncbi:terminus macrodomain insulation protein YfbV [Thorsellia anophelis]|uniref:UPF0208 membrane protein YfbV n=1 Tax=Thorsellia anophelis DSM 18579 TaxID=1123402 RepID=A0A1I0FFE8_9GAMM|nr:terminus macrodomain insulation protein YfbV [Thorsellia anophelis]SET55932.1 hypothetical protein SAMN02583745_02722 [Thorsellia anophelis DSM 18579]
MSSTKNTNSTPPKHSFWQILQAGQSYRKIFPMRKELAPVFKEFYVIKMTQFAIRTMPPLAVFFICWALMVDANIAMATTAATFALSTAVQCLYWLGKRALSPLPLGMLDWLKDTHTKLLETDTPPPPLTKQPNYQELAVTLDMAFKALDETFIATL